MRSAHQHGALAADKEPKVFKLSFITGLSGPLAQAAQTQKLAVELLVEQVNAKGGLNMPWGKVPVKLSIADDEMKLDVGVRRFREAVEGGAHGVSGSIYNPMSAALNEETKITGTPYIPGCVPALDAFKKGNPRGSNLLGGLYPLEHRLSYGRCAGERFG